MQPLREGLLVLALVGLSASLHAGEMPGAATNVSEGNAAARVRLLSASSDADAWLLGAWMARSWCRADANGCDPVQAGLLFERVLAQPPENPTVLRVVIDQLPVFLAVSYTHLTLPTNREV